MMRCDIVIATWNALAMTETALASIRRAANFTYRLILVDNSDEPEAREYFQRIADTGEFGETLLIQNEKNIGWLKATNIGLLHADADYVCLLNNDVVCGEDWLRRCIDLMQREPDMGLVNPRGNERSENRSVTDPDAYARHLAQTADQCFTELPHCSGFCLVVRRHLFEELGLLDEIFEGGYYEDNDFSYRARAAGYRCAQCDDAFVFHIGSQSFNKMPSDAKRRMIERNHQLCVERWGAVQRHLLLVAGPDISEERLIAHIRQHQTYLIINQYVPTAVREFRHKNLIPIRRAWLGGCWTFVFQWWYLNHKGRIDEGRVLFR